MQVRSVLNPTGYTKLRKVQTLFQRTWQYMTEYNVSVLQSAQVGRDRKNNTKKQKRTS